MAVTPEQLKRALERIGYRVRRTSDQNWLLVKVGKQRAISVPRECDFIDATLLDNLLGTEPGLLL